MTSTRKSEPIAITGMGLVTSLGLNGEATWRGMGGGECGVAPGDALESVLTPDPGVGQVRDTEAAATHREVIYLRRAISEAMAQAALAESTDRGRRALLIGTTLHGMRHGGHFLRTGDFDSLRHFLAGATLASVAGKIERIQFASTTCSACSSGLASVSLARSLLCGNEIDQAIVGGYDPISEYSYAGFNSMRLVSPTAVRPFAADRDGMKVAEGYAVVVLERSDAAEARGAKVLAWIAGMGESCDSFHLSKPHPEGNGAAQAIQQALKNAAIPAEDIDLIMAHGTATMENDAAEYAALKQVFGQRLQEIPLLATKSHLGHSLGAAGAVDLVIGSLVIRDQLIPPCANLRPGAPLIGALNLVQGAARRSDIRHVLTVSLGFGGANVACVLSASPSRCGAEAARFDSRAPAVRKGSSSTAERRVAISGLGVVVPGGAGNEAFARLLEQGRAGSAVRSFTVAQEELEPLINARRTRRMSEFAKLAIAATGEALRHAGVGDPALFCEDCSAILATMHGPTEFCESFYRQIVEEGAAAANPLLFAEGVPNVASAHLSTNFGIKGFCQTLIGSRTAGLNALSLARSRISTGQWERVIVGAAEEYTPLLKAVYDSLLPEAERLSPMSAAVTLLLESEESLRSRSGRCLGFLEGSISRHSDFSRLNDHRRHLRDLRDFIEESETCAYTGNATWVNRLEMQTLPRALRSSGWSLGAVLGECFSAAPLLAIAAAILNRGPLDEKVELPALAPAAKRLAVVCADYFGSVSALRLTLA